MNSGFWTFWKNRAIAVGQADCSKQKTIYIRLSTVGTWSRTVLTIAMFVCSMPTLLHAQGRELTIESSNIQPSVIVGRPMLTWWDIKIQGANLMKGRFHFDIKHGTQLLATSETEEMTLSGPEQRIRILLPAIDTLSPVDQLQTHITFRGKNYSSDLGDHILRCPFMLKKVLMGLVAESRLVSKHSAQREQLLEQLKFENIIRRASGRPSLNDDLEFVKTIFASIDPTDLPTEPLAYCSYDLVVLFGDDFRNLRKPQLDSLLAWVKAGGSVYAEPKGILEPYHVEFLRGLAEDGKPELLFQLDQSGHLLPELESAALPVVVIQCGVGTAAIRTVNRAAPIRIDENDWHPIVSSLWNARKQPAQRPGILQYVTGGTDGKPKGTELPNPDPFGLAMPAFGLFNISHQDLLDRLMPDGVQMMPYPILALILFGLVVLIGPGDYYVLGWLRRRKYTWITFPLATIGITAFTVWLSNRYMTSSESARSVIVCDLSQSGNVVRTNRFELHFLATSRQISTEIEKGLFAAPKVAGNLYESPATFMGINGQPIAFVNGQSRPRNIDSAGQVLDSLPEIYGRIPSSYSVHQDIIKWTPQLNRIFSIPGKVENPKIDWTQFELPATEVETIRRQSVPTQLINAVRQQFGQSAMVACFSGMNGWAYDRSEGWRSKRPIGYANLTNRNVGIQPNMVAALNKRSAGQFMPINRGVSGEAPFFRWLYDASVAPSEPGLTAIMKQRTPKGNATADDLSLLDSTDPNAWLLVVVVPTKTEFMVYRMPMRFPAP